MAVTEVGTLLGLGVLGGLWAVAWGHRRSAVERSAMLDARTQLQVRLDAVRARTAILSRMDPPPQTRRLLDEVVERQVRIDSVLSRAASPGDVHELDSEIGAALESLERAATLVGEEMPAADPFAGLCRVDPEHGPGASVATDGLDGWKLCSNCADAAGEGRLPPRRQVTRAGRPVPFDQVPSVP